ncbi:MAG: hypothetical protein QXH35_02325 [Nitrososphaerota archaeon]
MTSDKVCILCGEPLPLAEAVATRYPCLTSCLRLVDSRHLRECHGDFLKYAGREAPIYFYSFIALSLLALASVLVGDFLAALLVATLTAVPLIGGTMARRRLIMAHKMRAAYKHAQ